MKFYTLLRILPADVAYRQDLKSQLSQERETVRHVTLQRDIDVKELQSRLDKTVRHRAHGECTGPHSCNILDRTTFPNTRVPRWRRNEQDASPRTCGRTRTPTSW